MNSEDKKLWEAFQESVTPLKKNKKVARQKKSEKKASSTTSSAREDASPPPVAPGPAKIHTGQDRVLCRKLKKGTLSIEGRLDLHGYTQKEAVSALTRFLQSMSQQHKRVGLIITGKGMPLQGQEDASNRGVLRRQLPLWLGDEGAFPWVISLSQALPEHGGTGAFYVEVR